MKNKASRSGVVWVISRLLMLATWSAPKAVAQSAVRLNPVLQLGYGQAQDSTWSPIGDAFAVSSSSGVGVFRPTNGITYFKNALTTGFADLERIYGVANDAPIAGVWQIPAPELAPTFVPRQ